MTDMASRYARQMQLPQVGSEGQRRLGAARVLVAGCGALGTVVSESLVRAGFGVVTIVDRDLVEWSNLQRQTMFTEQDARRGVPKAEAAKARLAQLNSGTVVRAFVDDLRASNALRYAQDADLIVDCLDNFETRALLNDCAVLRRVPLIYGGAVGLEGMAAAILPHGGEVRAACGGAVAWSDERSTPCLRCLMPVLPAPGEVATCETVGVLGPVAGMVGAIEAGLAIRLLAEGAHRVPSMLVRFDFGAMRFASSSLHGARDPDCACCGRRRFEELSRDDDAREGRVLCGRNAVEIRLAGISPSEVAAAADADRVAERVAERLRSVGSVECQRHGDTRLIDLVPPDAAPVQSSSSSLGMHRLRVLIGPAGAFAVVEGTTDTERARSLVARWLGV